jgi:serine/threonine protein kinase
VFVPSLLATPVSPKAASNHPAQEWIILICMNDDDRTNLCAEKLSSYMRAKQQESRDFLTNISLGRLSGGMYAWVNFLRAKNRLGDPKVIEGFDKEAWEESSPGGPWIHKATCGMKDLIRKWASSEDVAKKLRHAKTMLSQSQESTLDAVNMIASDRLKKSNGTLYDPEDITLHQDKVIGSGQQSVVIEGLHKPTGKKLAVKSIDTDDTSTRRQLINSVGFFSESWVAKEKVDGLIRLHAIFADDARVYLAMDFMDIGGVNELLHMQWIQYQCGIPELVIAHTMRQALAGIQALHEHDLIHRDIKPENILVNSAGVTCVADFGLSILLEQKNVDSGRQDMKDGVVRARSFVGTERYLSPQRAQGRAITVKEDIWALGMVIYELATSRHVYSDLMDDQEENMDEGEAELEPMRNETRTSTAKSTTSSKWSTATSLDSTGQLSAGFAEVFGKLFEKLNELNKSEGHLRGLKLPPPREGQTPFSEELQNLVALCMRKKTKERPTASALRGHSFFVNKGADAAATQRDWNAWYNKVKQLKQLQRTV